ITGTGQLIGGVFWKKISSKTAYLERIVIHENYRKRQLARRLLNELFQRLKDRRIKYITVGFFQARLFYNIGFKIDKRFGGLVKEI
ncbi:MAG: GNAT family N-acetyltransferase, partial [Candidatus Neomarinimicrobiota bacterium]